MTSDAGLAVLSTTRGLPCLVVDYQGILYFKKRESVSTIYIFSCFIVLSSWWLSCILLKRYMRNAVVNLIGDSLRVSIEQLCNFFSLF